MSNYFIVELNKSENNHSQNDFTFNISSIPSVTKMGRPRVSEGEGSVRTKIRRIEEMALHYSKEELLAVMEAKAKQLKKNNISYNDEKKQ